MDGSPPGGPPAAPEGLAAPPATLAAGFAAAFGALELRAARQLLAEGLTRGISVAALYAQVVRPALSRTPPRDPQRTRLAASGAAAIMADLAAGLTEAGTAGHGRRALLRCPAAGAEAHDATVIRDFLEANGWSVERIGGDAGPDAVAAAARAAGTELMVIVVANAEEALRLAPACTELRRLPDTPVILLADFSPSPRRRQAALAMGADAVAHDPAEMIELATRHSPAPGHRRWGVRLAREGDELRLAPSGRLDTDSAERLIDVACTRSGSFTSLVLDLRDLAEIEADGLHGLERLHQALPGVAIRLISDTPSGVLRDGVAVAGARRALDQPHR